MNLDVTNKAEIAPHPPIVSPSTSLLSRTLSEFKAQEVLMLLAGVLFSLIAIVESAKVTEWHEVLLRMLSVTAIIAAMNVWTSYSNFGPRRWIKLFYIIPLIPLFFKTAELISFPIHGHDFDPVLIAIDRILCGGVNPTQWLYENFPHTRIITEYLTISYFLFYFLPLALAIELYRRGQKEETDQLFFVIVYGFLLSYICYFMIPSVGPRFTLHNFNDLPKDLPGFFLTDPMRTLLNRGENLQPGMSNVEALRVVTRDAFPSGHGDITLLTMVMAFHYRARSRWVILIFGSSLLFSTVYLRYHYVVDLIGGGLLTVITLYTWRWMRERMFAVKRLVSP